TIAKTPHPPAHPWGDVRLRQQLQIKCRRADVGDDSMAKRYLLASAGSHSDGLLAANNNRVNPAVNFDRAAGFLQTTQERWGNSPAPADGDTKPRGGRSQG